MNWPANCRIGLPGCRCRDVENPERSTLDTIAANLVAELKAKRQAYGNSTGTTAEIMRLLLPDGAKPEQYEDVQFSIRILDKIKRRLTSGAGDDEDAVFDLAGYAILWLERIKK